VDLDRVKLGELTHGYCKKRWTRTRKFSSALSGARVEARLLRSYHLTGDESYYGAKKKFKGKNEKILQIFYNVNSWQTFPKLLNGFSPRFSAS